VPDVRCTFVPGSRQRRGWTTNEPDRSWNTDRCGYWQCDGSCRQMFDRRVSVDREPISGRYLGWSSRTALFDVVPAHTGSARSQFRKRPRHPDRRRVHVTCTRVGPAMFSGFFCRLVSSMSRAYPYNLGHCRPVCRQSVCVQGEYRRTRFCSPPIPGSSYSENRPVRQRTTRRAG